MVRSDTTRETRLQRISGRVGRCAADVSTCALGITVASMITAQNAFGQTSGGRFQAAPKAPDADEAAGATDMILGIPVNTIFFVAAGVIAVFWFTLGGGRKAKVTGQQS